MGQGEPCPHWPPVALPGPLHLFRIHQGHSSHLLPCSGVCWEVSIIARSPHLLPAKPNSALPQTVSGSPAPLSCVCGRVACWWWCSHSLLPSWLAHLVARANPGIRACLHVKLDASWVGGCVWVIYLSSVNTWAPLRRFLLPRWGAAVGKGLCLHSMSSMCSVPPWPWAVCHVRAAASRHTKQPVSCSREPAARAHACSRRG